MGQEIPIRVIDASAGGGGQSGGGGGGGGGGPGSGTGTESIWQGIKKGLGDAEGIGKWGKGWIKFTANLAIAAALIAGGFWLLNRLMPDFSMEEIISASKKVAILVAAVGAGAALAFELSIMGKAIEAMPELKNISWGKLGTAAVLMAGATIVIPIFLVAMIALVDAISKNIGGGDMSEIVTASWQVAELMGAGALLIGGIALGVWSLSKLGALAIATGGAGLATAVGIGMAVVLAAMVAIPAFIGALYVLASAINLTGANPKTITKAFENIIGIMEPAAKLLGYIGLMTALLAGSAVGGLAAGAVGAVAYGIGYIANKAGAGINYGNPIEVIEDTLKRSFSLIQGAVTAVNKEIGSLTPEMVQSAITKLESFSGVQSLLGNVLSIYVDKFKEVLPAYIKISKLSNELRYTGSTSADEVADKFRSLTTIVSGIGKVIPDLNNISATLTESQLTSFTNFMNIFSKTALPLFNSLASIDTVVKSDSFKTVTSSQATFKKAGKILENVAPSLRSIMYNIQFVSKTLYEGLAGTPIEQLKEGAEVSSEIIMLFSNFVETVKKTSGSLKPKDMEEFEKVFGDPKIINSLRNVVQNTSKITDIFGQETRSSLDLKYIASNMKNYSEFYGGVSTLLKSYKEIQATVDPKEKTSMVLPGEDFIEITGTKNAASNFDSGAKTRLTNNITSAFNLVGAFIDSATNQSNLGSISKLPDALSNLKDLGEASTALGAFLTNFDTTVLTKVLAFSQTLSGISYKELQSGPNQKIWTGISAINFIISDVMKMFARISEGFTDGLKLINTDELNIASEKIVKISESIKTLIESIRTIGDPAEMGKIIKLADSMPKNKPPDLKDKFDNLKAYIDEISRIAAPDFMQTIVAIGRIKGISIESTSGEAIRLISSLTSFITNMQTEFGKLQSKTSSTTPSRGAMIGSAAPSIISAAKIDEVKNFLVNQALPAIKSMEDISKQLSSMPINETMVDDAVKKLDAFGKISSSLSTFNESMFKFQKQWTTKNITNKVNFSPSDVAKKKFAAFAKTNEDLDLYLREQEKHFGYKPEYWDETPFKESNLDAMTNIFNDPENKKMFELMGKIPSFYADNVLEPFVNGGGASLSIGGINFVKDAMDGIAKILSSFFGEKGVLDTVRNIGPLIKAPVPGTMSKLEQATKVLDDLGKDDVFLKFVSSTLENLIFPMLLAAKITGGSASLSEGVKSTGYFVDLIKNVPLLLNAIQKELSKVGTITDPKSVINNAKTQIDKLGNSLPLLLESLTLNVVIPVLENLLPQIYMDQATKRLGSAMTLVDNINNFGRAYQNIDAGLFSGLDKLSLVGSISKLLNTIDPVEGKLSSFSDKLIFIKDSLQSIADSMNSIVGLNVQGSIIDVLTKIGNLPTSGISAINNAGANLAKVSVDNFDNIKNKLQLEIMPNKNSPENESLEKLNEKEKTNLEKQDVVIGLLKNIHTALTISGLFKGEEPSTYTTSNTGKLGIENVTSNGNASSGNVLNSSSVQSSNANPVVG